MPYSAMNAGLKQTGNSGVVGWAFVPARPRTPSNMRNSEAPQSPVIFELSNITTDNPAKTHATQQSPGHCFGVKGDWFALAIYWLMYVTYVALFVIEPRRFYVLFCLLVSHDE